MILIQIANEHREGNYTFSLGSYDVNPYFTGLRFYHKIGRYKHLTTDEHQFNKLKEL